MTTVKTTEPRILELASKIAAEVRAHTNDSLQAAAVLSIAQIILQADLTSPQADQLSLEQD